MRVLLVQLSIGVASSCVCDSSTFLNETGVGEGYVAKYSNIESAAGCCTKCSSNSECVAWTYAAESSHCWLKDNARSLQSGESGRISGSCADSPPPPSPSPPPSPPAPLPSGSYYSDFSSSDGWEVSTDCGHCTHHDGDECAQYSKDAIQWSHNGAVVSTNKTSKAEVNLNSAASCSAGQTTAHIQWKESIVYGTYTVKAKFFPEGSPSGNAIAYIDMMGANSGSCTFILHGCTDSDTTCRSSINSACYGSNGDGHGKNKETEIPFDGDLREVNEFQLQFHKDDITWRINGVQVRHLMGSKPKLYLPHAPMTFRLHSRSQYVSKMINDFSATYYEFKFVPQSSYDSSLVV